VTYADGKAERRITATDTYTKPGVNEKIDAKLFEVPQ
jgi:hypothetical protein